MVDGAGLRIEGGLVFWVVELQIKEFRVQG